MSQVTDLNDKIFFYDDEVILGIFPDSPRLEITEGIQLNPGTQMNFAFDECKDAPGGGFDFSLHFYNEMYGDTSKRIPSSLDSDGPFQPENLDQEKVLGLSVRSAANLLQSGSIKHSGHGQTASITFSALVRLRALEALTEEYEFQVKVNHSETKLVFSRYGQEQFRNTFNTEHTLYSEPNIFMEAS